MQPSSPDEKMLLLPEKVVEKQGRLLQLLRRVGVPLIGLTALLAASLLFVRSKTKEADIMVNGLPSFAGFLPLGPRDTGDFICKKGVEYKDFATLFPNVTRRQCAAFCYGMPDCAAWSHRPNRDSVYVAPAEVAELRAWVPSSRLGLCKAHYGNTTVVENPDVESCVQLTHRPLDINHFIGATHWQGCYYRTDKPYLLDGAREVQDLGSRTMKVSLNFHAPWDDYPWNSDWGMEGWRYWTPDPVEVAKHPYFQQLFTMHGFDTFVLVAYSSVARSTGEDEWKAWLDPWYWIFKDPTPEQLKEETRQFYDLAHHLASTYSDKTFILQMWEGDWTLRQDMPVEQHYNEDAVVDRVKAQRMVKWLAARQEGVTRARRTLGDKAMSNIYHAGEVNLVRQSSLDIAANGSTDRVDMVTAVLPHVALDMVSYSCYDAGLAEDSSKGGLWRAIQLVKRAHRRTEASPEQAVFLGEFGVPVMNRDWDDIMCKVKNAVNVAAAAGLRHMVYWQIFDNTLNPTGKKKYQVDRCDSRMLAHGPVKDQSLIEGFFIVHPDRAYRPHGDYLYTKLHDCPAGQRLTEGNRCAPAPAYRLARNERPLP